MAKSVTTMIAVLALAGGLSAQSKKTEPQGLTGTWNMGLQGGHVIPVALVLKQDGEALAGTFLDGFDPNFANSLILRKVRALSPPEGDVGTQKAQAF